MNTILQLHRQIDQCIEYNDLANAHDYVHDYFQEHTNQREILQTLDFMNAQNKFEFTGNSDDPMIITNSIWHADAIDFDARKKNYDNIKYIFIETTSDQVEELIANDFYKATAPYSEFIPSLGYLLLDLYREIAKTNTACRPDIVKLTELNLFEQQTLIKARASELAKYHDLKVEECLNNVPSDIPIYKIKFKDILENKELVLSTLETVTGFKRTQAISDSYDIYIDKQRELYRTKLSWIRPK